MKILIYIFLSLFILSTNIYSDEIMDCSKISGKYGSLKEKLDCKANNLKKHINKSAQNTKKKFLSSKAKSNFENSKIKKFFTKFKNSKTGADLLKK